jgi:hypothetical protein
MAQQIINVGASPNDGQGNTIRQSFTICNTNFSELYSRVQTSPPASLIGSIGDTAGMYAYDTAYFYYCFADFDGSSVIWGQITQSANISATQLQFGTTLVDIPVANGNVEISVDGTANVAIFNSAGLLINGRLSTTGNLVVANISTVGTVVASGNITGNYIFGNGSQLSGLPETYANANVAAYLPTYTGNLSGAQISVTGNITGNNVFSNGEISVAGNIIVDNSITVSNTITNTIDSLGANLDIVVDTNFGGNVDVSNSLSVGETLSVIGNTTIDGTTTTANLNTNGTVSVTGNIVTDAYFVGTFVGNVTGNFVVPGANTEVLFNTNGNADAVPGLTYNVASNTLGVLGPIIASGNITGGNLQTAGLITATGNILGGNLRTAGLITATGNILGGNLRTAGLITATGTISTATGIFTDGNISVAGNVISQSFLGVELRVTGIVSATGNILTNNGITGQTITGLGNITGANLNTNGRVLATGNVTGGNLTTGGQIVALANITGANILSTGFISAAGNLTAANFSIVSNVSAQNLQIASNINGANLNISGNGVIGGDLTVNGNLAYVNVTTLSVEDPIIEIGRGANGNALISNDGKDRGEQLWYYGSSEKSAFIGYNNSVNKLVAALSVTVSNEIATVLDYGNIVLGNIESQGTVSATGNISGNYFLGNGSQLTGVTATDVGTLSTLSVTGNTDTGNLLTGGTISSAGNILTGGLISASGNIICGNIENSNANGVGNIGSSTTYFDTVFAKATSAQYADLAEMYVTDADYEPGTVVMFGGSNEVTECDQDLCPAVAGVISTQPAYLMNAELAGQHLGAVALMGRVPCKVQGPVFRGSLMVSAGNGRARAEKNPAPGTIIGKAIESFNGDTGIIEILVGRV